MSLSAPQHSFSLFLTKSFNEKYNGSLGYYYVEDFTWTDSRGTGDYNILDMRLSRNLRFEQTRGSLSIVLKNLLDDYSDYNENPRNSTSPQVIQNTVAYIDFRLIF
jgi:outer membrane receptor protein involved in Fe transport